MNWYEVEAEIDFFGKTTELIQAENREDCELIALHLISKKFNCPKKIINVIFCRKILNSKLYLFPQGSDTIWFSLIDNLPVNNC